MSGTIQDVLARFREDAANNRSLGDKFERLIESFLKKDPGYAELYSNVWLWMDYPGRKGRPDTGIDLVAEERATGELTAIQCKFYDENHILSKEDIDSFFTASGKSEFQRRLIVSTTDKWSKHAEEACEGQSIPVSRLRVQDLGESCIDWSDFDIDKPSQIKRLERKTTRPHQKTAIEKVIEGFKRGDRGKLIMACGTGKTFTALKLTEQYVPEGGRVLFLVPSISLLQQTLTEWTSESSKPLSSFAVCSDSKVGGKKDESSDITTHDLAFPAHTNSRLLVKHYGERSKMRSKNINVFFSTYQSIKVIAEAQEIGLPKFDLIICDEAHRTTGVEQDDADFSSFVAVHKKDYVKGAKRLYMTATPRIYDDASKSKAKDAEVAVYSMDDEEIYGEEFHRLDFSEAVRKGLLTDYKVLVLAVDEKSVSKAFQRQIADKNNEIALDDVVKIVGCYNGLRKRFVSDDGTEDVDPSPMKRAVAFSRSIKDSKRLKDQFSGIIRKYEKKSELTGEELIEDNGFLRCEIDHVDGTFNALERSERLQWLKADTSHSGQICRILSNARCLSEGVDVPALDAVMFLNPRNSVVDVVQSVGRVMRKSDGKKYGYIILPIGVPADMAPEEALNNHEKYKVVWQVLQALRAHDDRFNATINQIELNKERTRQIQVIGVGADGHGDGVTDKDGPVQTAFEFPQLEEWENAIFAKIVMKCGNRRYWEDWAKDIAQIAERHVTRIKALVEGANPKHQEKFERFLKGLRKTLNPSITAEDAIEMLAQHMVTKPVFDALFENYEFTKLNPVSKTMQRMVDLLEEQSIEKEVEVLGRFYNSVRERVQGVDNAQGRQKIVVELYDKFFRTAFPKMSERLGIVYTPVEVVDFIIRSADQALRQEFKSSLADEGIHILDPFTGTGTFMVRLLQSGIIKEKDLPRKFRDELHANELVLLAYYIAAINIEEAYHGQVDADYEPFDGILLTDTFQLTEGRIKGKSDEQKNAKTRDAFKEDAEVFQNNSERGKNQNTRDIRVIIGNPPYSSGQKSENDNNQNLAYPFLDSRISESYSDASTATLQKNLYDSYVRSIRWTSDRIGERGIICFVTNASFIDARSMDGLRKCLGKEFTSIYCFNLRGDQRTQGEVSRKEGGKIFGSGSRTPIAITLLIKNPAKKGPAKIHYHDIGDYLSREEKLEIITNFGDFTKIPWQVVTPNKDGDWINQRDEAFEKFIPAGDKESKGEADTKAIFVTYSQGVLTARDAWTYGFSKRKVGDNMKRMIAFYNQQHEDFKRAKSRNGRLDADDFVETDPKKISWTGNLKSDLGKDGRQADFDKSALRLSAYRPFCKQWLYYDRQFNERVYRIPDIFPKSDSDNLVISVSGAGGSAGFSALISNTTPNYDLLSKGQSFPLYTYPEDAEPGEFNFGATPERIENVSKASLEAFRKAYSDKSISGQDIFYYVYGIFHSQEYKRRFSSDLNKMLPRIPFAKDFWAFSKAGRKLADIHINYEQAKPFPLKESRDELGLDETKLYQVEKMRFGKTGKEVDKTKIQYNSHITLTGIPLSAYEYMVNGRPAIEWIMDRYEVTRNKDSDIGNNPNDWAKESNDPKYVINLIKRIVTISVETMKIVASLPPLEEIVG
jgi:predicted helicase